jgi:DedD protein
MDRTLVERMVGAVVLVFLLVIFAPALLDGSADNGAAEDAGDASDSGTRTQVIILNAPVNAPVNTPVQAVDAPREAPRKVAVAAAPVAAAKSSTVVEKAPPQGFAVQLGSFSAVANARRYTSEVKAQGFNVFVIRASSSGAAVYRVYSGPESSREKAGALAGKLKAAGHNVMVVDLGS